MKPVLIVAVVAMASCGFPPLEKEPPAEDAAPITSLVLEGGVFTAGGLASAQTLDLVDDGLEVDDWSCIETFCITGGLQP